MFLSCYGDRKKALEKTEKDATVAHTCRLIVVIGRQHRLPSNTDRVIASFVWWPEEVTLAHLNNPFGTTLNFVNRILYYKWAKRERFLQWAWDVYIRSKLEIILYHREYVRKHELALNAVDKHRKLTHINYFVLSFRVYRKIFRRLKERRDWDIDAMSWFLDDIDKQHWNAAIRATRVPR